ncbi:Os06g0652250 [Oryza sativa Japonica Group]|uniref:Os06g0652250 protein n=1 Tax=Oryza sativa subsp. japonica TaxID=39947 RepID=A0A0P0WZD2_ORYSJ|nr:Os06g0652250 [Oryza sativa Japonica Group]
MFAAAQQRRRILPLQALHILLVSHDALLADDATKNVMIPGAALTPAAAAAGRSVPPATASHRNRKKPPRWLQTLRVSLCQAKALRSASRTDHSQR